MQLEIGEVAPSFALQNQDGVEVRLQDILGKYLVLYFYPKDNTSGCSLEAQDFTSLLSEFQALGANVVGVSPDSIQSHKRFIEAKGLKLMLLSDPDRSVSASYGAFGEKKMYGKVVQGIIRSTFVLSSEGKILKTFYNVKAKEHASKVLEFVKTL